MPDFSILAGLIAYECASARDRCLDGILDLRVFRKPVSRQLGEDQRVVHRDFEPASSGRHELQLFDIVFVVLQQFHRQPGGVLFVASISAVNDSYDHRVLLERRCGRQPDRLRKYSNYIYMGETTWQGF